MQKPLQSKKHAIMQLISTNKYFGKNLQEKLTSAISMILIISFYYLILTVSEAGGRYSNAKKVKHIVYSSLATVIIKHF